MALSEAESLVKKFKEEFEQDAEVCVVVPGRVNIIGEHVDYSGFPVLPMALQRCVMVAAASNVKSGDPPTLELSNVDSNHPTASCCLSSTIEIDYLKEGWSCYFLCGMRGALECREGTDCKSIVAMVSGSVPPGAGLSSSSALVCAAFLATAKINKIEVSMEEAAVKCASCERYIGTEGGGMDQAIALLASSGCAKLVEFEPKLEATNVCLPKDAVFVVAHSQATKNKAASSEFNTRVVECRLAAQILAKSKGADWRNIRKLKTAIDQLGVPLAEASALVNEILTQESYTKAQVCEELGVSEEELDHESLSHNTKQVQEFKLRQRALHVYQEAQRVYLWKKAAEACNLAKMGQLMNDSHASLSDLYECSHPQVDSLVEACKAAGALGARITGAGWGGCIVALTTKNHVDKFISTVKSTYYCDKQCDDLIFPTSPAPGAVIHTYSPSL